MKRITLGFVGSNKAFKTYLKVINMLPDFTLGADVMQITAFDKTGH